MNFGWISNLVFLVASSLRRDHKSLEALCMRVRLHDQNSLLSRIVRTKIRSAFVLTRNETDFLRETEILRRYQLNLGRQTPNPACMWFALSPTSMPLHWLHVSVICQTEGSSSLSDYQTLGHPPGLKMSWGRSRPHESFRWGGARSHRQECQLVQKSTCPAADSHGSGNVLMLNLS